MKKLVTGLIVAGTLVVAAPAMAQVVVDSPVFGFRVGPDPYYRDYGRSYYVYDDKYRDCRTVTVRERAWDGSIIVRTREVC